MTVEMTRLCGEIASLRNNRADLVDSIKASNSRLQKEVAEMLAGFRKERSEMADATRAQLVDFTGRIKNAVTELRHQVQKFQGELRDDLAGAHRAWYGAPKLRVQEFVKMAAPQPTASGESEGKPAEPVETVREESVSQRKRGGKKT